MDKDEVRRITSGPGPGERPEGVGIERIAVTCAGSAEEALIRVKKCLADAISGELKQEERFPSWFHESFSEGSLAAERFRSDGNDGPAWTLTGWLFWLDPDERLWRWWDGKAESEHRLIIMIDALDWPTPTGALKWLLYGAGAVEVEYLE